MVVVRYQSFAANAVLTHRFESVAPSSRDGNCGLVKVERFASLSASFTSRFFRPRGTFAGFLNLFGPLQAARRFVSSLRQLLKIKFGLLRLGWTLRRRTRKGR